ncbi:MAG: GntR family transcriptional regulator [Mycobacteriales bacterium]
MDAKGVAFRSIRSGNAFEECVERVLSALRLGLVSTGERLPAERDLAARLGVSRLTLREALRSLADAGWLEIRRGRHGGTFVLDRVATGGVAASPGPAPSAAAIEDTLVLRRVLELGAVEAAASSGLRVVRQTVLLAALEECSRSEVQHYRRADSRLHLVITEATGSPSLVAAAADVRMRVNHLLDAIPLVERNLIHSNAQHEHIVRAIGRGQPTAARAAMDEHLAGTAALLRGFLL